VLELMVKAFIIHVEASLSGTDYSTTFANDLRARIAWYPPSESYSAYLALCMRLV